ncbi:hypothetical protein Tco_1501942 [Tanacetum coccineum]
MRKGGRNGMGWNGWDEGAGAGREMWCGARWGGAGVLWGEGGGGCVAGRSGGRVLGGGFGGRGGGCVAEALVELGGGLGARCSGSGEVEWAVRGWEWGHDEVGGERGWWCRKGVGEGVVVDGESVGEGGS